VEIDLKGKEAKEVLAQVLSGNIQDHNNFDSTDSLSKVKVVPFEDIKIVSNKLSLTMPPCSVMGITVK